MNFLFLLLLERDDVVVDVDGAEGLEVKAGAGSRTAVNDAGNGRSVFGAHNEYVSSVAVGDDLLLQIFGGVFAAEIRLERATQPGPLFPQPFAEALQLRTRIVYDFAAG